MHKSLGGSPYQSTVAEIREKEKHAEIENNNEREAGNKCPYIFHECDVILKKTNWEELTKVAIPRFWVFIFLFFFCFCSVSIVAFVLCSGLEL